MKALLCSILLACGSATPAPHVAVAGDPTIVTVATGQLRGEHAGTTLTWKGIPYAAPPIGELRWRPPAPALAWPGMRDATGYGSICMQAGTSDEPGATVVGSEDCLTLDVWRPASATGPLPVMVFVHGGYFTWGASSYRRFGVELYDGAQLATAANAVVVTLNYRLGPFGFLAHPALADEDPHHATGDYGLLDQLAALRWVQQEIGNFGGDRTHVTLFGQSAGAISSAALYASPLARGLFAGVIMHSGNGDAIPLAKAERGGAELARRVHCATAACLRDRSAVAIAGAMPESFDTGYRYGPVVDGWVLPRTPLELVERGEANHVPLIVSTTSNEFSTMVKTYLTTMPLTDDASYTALLAHFFGPLGPRLQAHYPAAKLGGPLAAFTAMMSDGGFICQSEWFAAAAAAHQREPVRRFVFDHTYTGPLAYAGAGHGLDMYMLFRNDPFYVVLTAPERALADEWVTHWARFAAGAPDPSWPTVDQREQLELGGELHVAPTDATDRCEFWRPILTHTRPPWRPTAS